VEANQNQNGALLSSLVANHSIFGSAHAVLTDGHLYFVHLFLVIKSVKSIKSNLHPGANNTPVREIRSSGDWRCGAAIALPAVVCYRM
jgi:hypothetical protein